MSVRLRRLSVGREQLERCALVETALCLRVHAALRAERPPHGGHPRHLREVMKRRMDHLQRRPKQVPLHTAGRGLGAARRQRPSPATHHRFPEQARGRLHPRGRSVRHGEDGSVTEEAGSCSGAQMQMFPTNTRSRVQITSPPESPCPAAADSPQRSSHAISRSPSLPQFPPTFPCTVSVARTCRCLLPSPSPHV